MGAFIFSLLTPPPPLNLHFYAVLLTFKDCAFPLTVVPIPVSTETSKIKLRVCDLKDYLGAKFM